MNNKRLFQYQDKVLQALKNTADPFYLAGGTALSKFYFQHRESFDLDFFTQDYKTKQIRTLVQVIEKSTGKKMKLARENKKDGLAKLQIWNLEYGPEAFLKIDFVEDVIPLIAPLKIVDGIRILSLDDIYLRKIHAISGTFPEVDKTGKVRFLGGRQEGRDFFDVYLLSSTYKRLSLFAVEHCDEVQREALVRWYHTYSRQKIKIGLIDLRTHNPIEFVIMERHFKKEIAELIGEIL